MSWLLWLDLETTGLNYHSDQILEVGWQLTQGIIWERKPKSSIVAFPDLEQKHFSDKKRGSAWKMHTDNGLITACRNGGRELWDIEEDILNDIVFVPSSEHIYLAGNSIHFDRNFIKTRMPSLDYALHYRMIDVTSVMMTLQLAGLPINSPTPSHRTKEDVIQSHSTWLQCISIMKERLVSVDD